MKPTQTQSGPLERQIVEYSHITGEWDEIFIIAGGSSLSGFDFTRLKDKFTVGVNDSALFAKTNALCSIDRNWLKGRYKHYKDFPGEKCFAINPSFNAKALIDPNAIYVHRKRGDGMNERNNQLNGTNSGFATLNWAYHKNAKKIIMMGFDMCHVDKKRHWHTGYKWGSGATNSMYAAWAKDFAVAAKQFKRSGTIVINVSPISIIEGFERGSIDDFC